MSLKEWFEFELPSLVLSLHLAANPRIIWFEVPEVLRPSMRDCHAVVLLRSSSVWLAVSLEQQRHQPQRNAALQAQLCEGGPPPGCVHRQPVQGDIRRLWGWGRWGGLRRPHPGWSLRTQDGHQTSACWQRVPWQVLTKVLDPRGRCTHTEDQTGLSEEALVQEDARLQVCEGGNIQHHMNFFHTHN